MSASTKGVRQGVPFSPLLTDTNEGDGFAFKPNNRPFLLLFSLMPWSLFICFPFCLLFVWLVRFFDWLMIDSCLVFLSFFTFICSFACCLRLWKQIERIGKNMPDTYFARLVRVRLLLYCPFTLWMLPQRVWSRHALCVHWLRLAPLAYWMHALAVFILEWWTFDCGSWRDGGPQPKPMDTGVRVGWLSTGRHRLLRKTI